MSKLSAEPIECPRGWGKVGFQMSGLFMLPFVSIGRTCPISAAESCSDCQFESNPDAMSLRENLGVLDEMRNQGVLTREEYEVRRSALVSLHPVPSRRAAFRTTAWILGPLGSLFALGGAFLALRHGSPSWSIAFWCMASIGAILIALTISFAALALRTEADVRLRENHGR